MTTELMIFAVVAVISFPFTIVALGYLYGVVSEPPEPEDNST